MMTGRSSTRSRDEDLQLDNNYNEKLKLEDELKLDKELRLGDENGTRRSWSSTRS